MIAGHRMVRNLPMERWITGAAQPFAPRYDVEAIDALGFPIQLLATGVTAEVAKAIIARAAIKEVTDV